MANHSELITNIKFAHISLLDSIDQIKQTIRSYEVTKPKLRNLQEKLFAHFTQQKSDLYDQLTDSLKGDRHKTKMVEFLIVNLKDLKIRTVEFYDLHPADVLDLRPKNFPVDFLDFSGEIMARVKSEEDYLLPYLEEISKQ